MSAVLGISGFYHDAAAALVVDGTVVAAMHEERFDRMKHSAALPERAARACLEMGGIDARALDAVIFYEEPFPKFERLLEWLVGTFPRAPRYFTRALRSELSRKLWVLDEISETLGVVRERVRAVPHHLSHAASAFFVSPFEEAAVLTVDGVGERTTTAIWHGRGTSLEPRFSIEFPHSLGLFYAAITAYAGFEVLEGELKLMALAAYGEPRHVNELSRVLRLGGCSVPPAAPTNRGISLAIRTIAVTPTLREARSFSSKRRCSRSRAGRVVKRVRTRSASRAESR
jgi:carbamoyltransferase